MSTTQPKKGKKKKRSHCSSTLYHLFVIIILKVYNIFVNLQPSLFFSFLCQRIMKPLLNCTTPRFTLFFGFPGSLFANGKTKKRKKEVYFQK